MSFEEAYKEYEIYAKNRHKKQGFITITKNFNLHILPYFKNKCLISLTKLDIINWQNEILSKNFSNNFNRNLYYEFSAFFRYCIYCDYLKENLVLQVPKFKKKIEHKEYNVYTLKEFRELDTPKNQSSIRTLKLNLITIYRFKVLKNMYLKKYGQSDDYFVFGGIKPLAPTTIDRCKLKACNKANMNPITQHEFRHSYATRMIKKKKPINEVSKSMGHSTISMTVDVYLH